MSILLPSRSLYQPQGAARINWANDLTRNLVQATTSEFRDPAKGLIESSGVVTRVGSPRGLLYNFDGSSKLTYVNAEKITPPFTVAFDVIFQTVGFDVFQVIVSQGGVGVTNGFKVAVASNGIRLTFGGVADYFISNSTAANTLYRVCVTVSGNGGTAIAYRNGASVGSVAVGTMQTPASTGTVIGADPVSFVLSGTRIGNIALWNRALSPYEVAQLTENPWQIFESQQRKRLIVDFGSAPTTGWTYKVRQAPIQQPATPVANEGHPMSSGLVAWQTGYASSGFTEINTTPVVSGAHGFARRFAYLAGDANAHYLALQRTRRTASGAATIATLLRVNSSYTTEGSYQVPVALSRAVITDYMQLELSVSGGVGSWSFKLSASGVNAGLSAPYTVGDEQWHFIVCRQSHPTYRDIWIDGVNVAQQVGSSNPANLNYAYVGASALSTSISGWAGDIALALFWNRGLTDNEMRSLSKNPWQLFQQPRRIHASTKIYRPYSDITTTGWTARPDAPYFRQLAETVPSDSNYIFSPDPSGSPGAFVAGLNASMEAGTYNIKFRARKTTSAGQIRATLLDASGSSVGASGWISLTTGFADYTATVTSSAPAARIKLEVQP